MYVLSYQGPKFTNVTVVKVTDKEQGEAYTATLSADGDGVDIYVNFVEDLRQISRATLNILYNALAEEPVKKFDNQMVASTRLFALLGHVAKEWDPSTAPAPPAPAPATDQAESSAPDSETTEEGSNLAEPASAGSADQQEADMAKKSKTKAKKSTKAPKAPKAAKVAKTPKAKDGLPRAGSKKAELLRLLQRANGATMAEMLEATGWKACLGTAKAVATAAKLKFRHERGADGKPSRWYAE